MKPNQFSTALGAALVLCAATANAETGFVHNPAQTFHHENVLGTSMELKVKAHSEFAAAAAEANALAEIDRLAKILSGYDSASEFSRWMAQPVGRAVPVSRELMEVLGLFERWQARTDGALNASAETAVRVWKAAAAANRVPTDAELRAAVTSMSRPHWRLDRDRSTATRLTDAAVRLNSFAKIYIVDRAVNAAASTPDVTGVMLNIGGDIVTRGDMNDTVSIADPVANADNAAPIARLAVANSAVATSGNYKRGFEIGGRHYSHIIDPRTALTAEETISATVIAPNATDAGALATAFTVLDPAESGRIADLVPGVEYLIVRRDGSRIESDGWTALQAPEPVTLASSSVAANQRSAAGQSGGAAAAAANWNSAFELVVNFELPRIDNQRYRRPFVAVWIEDKDKFPLRTIALWFDKPRWIPDLRSWHRGDRMRALAEGTEITNTVSSATRPPGKYTLKWDGKDSAGKLVKAGKYAVCIEVAREHGSYQIIRQEIDFTGVPKQMEFPGGPEIGSASIDYRKAAR